MTQPKPLPIHKQIVKEIRQGYSNQRINVLLKLATKMVQIGRNELSAPHLTVAIQTLQYIVSLQEFRKDPKNLINVVKGDARRLVEACKILNGISGAQRSPLGVRRA